MSKRPKLARHVGIIASLWSFVEARLGDLLGQMLRADRHIGSLMYMQIKSEPARLSVMQAVAEDRLPPLQLESLLQLKKRISKTGGERDRVVHALWALPEDKQDSIVWLDPREHAMFWAASATVHRKGKRRTQADEERLISAYRNASEGTYIYNEKDFLEIEKRIRERITEIMTLSTHIWWVTDRRRSSPRHEMTARRALTEGKSAKIA